MKKSLFAVAAAGAFAGVAGTAAAQSSVTVYGLLDLGYVGGNSRTASGAANQSTAVTRASGNAFGQGGESTNRLGFRGTEDIGGGLSAFFTVEWAITPNSAQNVSTSATSNRQTFAGLKKNGIGQFSLGTQYTAVHDAVAVTDPGQANNIVGNVIYMSSSAPTTVATASGTGNTSNTDTNIGYVVRQNNMLKVKSENISGFVGNAFYVMNNNTTTQTASASNNVVGGTNNNSGYGVGLDFTLKSFYATANYQSFKSTNPWSTVSTASLNASTGATASAAGTTGTPALWGVAGASAPGANIQDNTFYGAATYDFGILKAYAQYINRQATSQLNTANQFKRSGTQIGVRSFVTPTIETWANIGTGRYQAYGASLPTANFTAYQIGANYWLSKRTNLYSIFGAQATSNANNGNTTGTVATSSNINNYAVGIRHTF